MSFRFEKLTTKAQQAVANAQTMAGGKGHPQITTLHLLGSLLQETDGIVLPLITKIGAPTKQLIEMVDGEIARLPSASGGSTPSPDAELQKVFESASKAAETMQDEFISTEHLLIGLANPKNAAGRLLELNAIDKPAILEALKTVRGSARVTDQSPEGKYQSLEKYCIDLVQQAQSGKLDPVIGRDEEIRRVIQVLSRRTKNNPVLIGQPGVGKLRSPRAWPFVLFTTTSPKASVTNACWPWTWER